MLIWMSVGVCRCQWTNIISYIHACISIVSTNARPKCQYPRMHVDNGINDDRNRWCRQVMIICKRFINKKKFANGNGHRHRIVTNIDVTGDIYPRWLQINKLPSSHIAHCKPIACICFWWMYNFKMWNYFEIFLSNLMRLAERNSSHHTSICHMCV